MLADHFGLLGLPLRPASLARMLGVALVLGGAILVQRG
jgi:transporter family-2 protein